MQVHGIILQRFLYSLKIKAPWQKYLSGNIHILLDKSMHFLHVNWKKLFS